MKKNIISEVIFCFQRVHICRKPSISMTEQFDRAPVGTRLAGNIHLVLGCAD